ncbi:MAG: hypothetical protein ACXWNZ_03020 [Vulcanimicrobiaceae bacterium]
MRRRGPNHDTSIRHLLRHLGDAKHLRANPLVAHLFTGDASIAGSPAEHALLAKIRSEVARAADELQYPASGLSRLHNARQRSIVVRCDLGEEVHKSVAADFGLSLRQFYRERRKAQARLGETLRNRLPRPQTELAELNRRDFALAQARSLRDAGRVDAAIETLLALAGEHDDVDRKIDLLALAADWMTDAQRLDRAEATLAIAAQWTSRLDAGPSARAHARIDVVRGALAWSRGDSGASRELSLRGITVLRGTIGGNDRSSQAALALALLRQAAIDDDLGFLFEALRSLEAVGELLTRIDPSPSDLYARYLTLVALLRAELHGNSPLADAAVERAIEHARSYPFSSQTVLAVVAASIHLEMNRAEPLRALRMLYDCVPFAQTVCLPADLGLLYKRIAECEALNGDLHAAHDFATRARCALPQGSLGWIDAHCFEAMAALGNKDYAQACTAAQVAADGARRMNNKRRLGCALRLLAEGYEGLSRRGESATCIEEAVSILEGHTHPRALALAYRTSARLTGNSDHRRLATELARA